MGLTTWKGARVRKADVTVAKNYLREEEIQELNRIVTMYLDYAEDQASRRKTLYMRDWREKLDAFLQFNERDILTNAGKVAKEVADRLALEQYEQFHTRRLAAEASADEQAFDTADKESPRQTDTQETWHGEKAGEKEMIRDHIAANLGIEPDDFEYAPFAQEGGLGKVYQLFGDELNTLIEQLNESLAA